MITFNGGNTPSLARPRARRRHPLSSSSSPIVCSSSSSPSTRGAPEPPPPPPVQVELDATSALAYARAHLPHLFAERGGPRDGKGKAKRRDGGDGGGDNDAQVEELSGGVINRVFAMRDGAVLKQALPHVRAVGPSLPLSRKRMDAEAAAMALAERAAAAASSSQIARPPSLLHFDRAQSVLVCERVPEDFAPLYDALLAGRLPAGPVAAPLFRLLARLQRPTTATEATTRQTAAALKNENMVRANLDVVLRQPFGLLGGDDDASAATALAAAPLHLRADAERLLVREPAVRRAARALDAHYAARSQSSARRHRGLAFAHNDLHPGNVFVVAVDAEQGMAALMLRGENSDNKSGGGASSPSAAPLSAPPYLIDWEFAAPGPAEFDVGTFAGNLFVAALVLPLLAIAAPPSPGASATDSVRLTQRDWLLAEAAGAWRAHEQAAKQNDNDEQERWAVAWAGAAVLRQVLGLHRHPLLRLLPSSSSSSSSSSVEAVAAVERSCLALGRAMLLAAPVAAAGEDDDDDKMPPPLGAVASFGGAAAIALELARTHDDLHCCLSN